MTAKTFTSTKDHHLNTEEGGRYKLYEYSISHLLYWISFVLSKYGSCLNSFVGLPSRNTRVNHHMKKGSCSASSLSPWRQRFVLWPRYCEIHVGQSGAQTCFLQVFWFYAISGISPVLCVH